MQIRNNDEKENKYKCKHVQVLSHVQPSVDFD